MMRGTLKRLACSLFKSCDVKQNSPLSLSVVQSAKLFVGGISPFTTSDALREAFEPFGKVQSAWVFPGRGFGFVIMPNDAEAEGAIKSLHGTRVADAERVTVEHVKPPPTRGPTIVLHNLPPDTSASELKKALSQFGKVLELRPMKGHAFALFDSPESAEKAIEGIAQEARLGPFSSVYARLAEVRMNRLFVTKLTEDVSISLLKESFERFGRVDEITKFADFAFVTMDSPEAAMDAMRALYGTRMGQATNIVVKPSSPRGPRSGKAHTTAIITGGQRPTSAVPAGVGRRHDWRDRSDQWDNRWGDAGLGLNG